VLRDLPDPVFAGEMVGPGVAIDPDPGEVTVTAPIAGRVVKVHPHAFVILSEDGVGVLVHLGINTNRLEGRGFEVLSTQGAQVEAGDPMVRWDPSAVAGLAGEQVEGQQVTTFVPVVVMDRPAGSVEPVDVERVAAGDRLFSVVP
jgi:glucose-specific phosphotransferase system IIA component